MNSRTLPDDSCRYEGCTLTGALSVTTQIRDAVTVVHGPAGCAHHNFSILHAISAEQERPFLPPLVSTALGENDVIFGGEERLGETLDRVARQGPAAIFVLSTCITETIGDDCGAVCGEERGVPVIPVPSAGFFGGAFSEGLNGALSTIIGLCDGEMGEETTVNIIGEKNLEFEVDQNYAEVERLLSLIGVRVNLRFVRSIAFDDLKRVGDARLNILREPALRAAGDELKERFGTPFVDSFPIGLEGSIAFLQEVGDALGVPVDDAVEAETARQTEMLASFEDMRGMSVSPDSFSLGSLEYAPVRRVMDALDLQSDSGDRRPLPYSPPVGTAGIRRLLHRWRRGSRV
ncbi:nitrogenase component 1 [Methanofollis fontis]|uniref:Oxidoreductase n=1 Tax=Methanofollis fontis TaxID=2052832 RepID=A0A483CPC1_9EURY|nr:nitrogenase component 1 [Methanofollis fontis]TAJ44545.1 oxidoreductase [Methanofollis fontis]